MSHKEALEDNICSRKDRNGFSWYYPKCDICGVEVPSWGYTRGKKYVCNECRKELVKFRHDKSSSVILTKKERKFESALKRIGKVTDIKNYESAIKLIKPLLSRRGWFQSTEEIMVALELAKQEIKFYHQVKVFNYSVDFVIPSLQIALEIDGEPFHRLENKKQSDIRDELIKNKLGSGYEVVHIKTECVNMNVTRLMKGITAVLKHRKRVHTNSL